MTAQSGSRSARPVQYQASYLHRRSLKGRQHETSGSTGRAQRLPSPSDDTTELLVESEPICFERVLASSPSTVKIGQGAGGGSSAIPQLSSLGRRYGITQNHANNLENPLRHIGRSSSFYALYQLHQFHGLNLCDWTRSKVGVDVDPESIPGCRYVPHTPHLREDCRAMAGAWGGKQGRYDDGRLLGHTFSHWVNAVGKFSTGRITALSGVR